MEERWKNPTGSMGARIKQFRREAGYSQKDIAEIMGVTRNTVINWEGGKYRPDADLFPFLCDVLGVTLNDLFGVYPEERVSAHEKMLIKQYRQIRPAGRKIVERIIRDMLDEEMKEKEKNLDEGTILLARISTKAAAGNGLLFSDIPIEDYCFVFRDDRNENADAVIMVKGDSMEPVFHDGDLVYVQYADSALAGEDIICSSRSGIHIKRMGDEGPYSLNKSLPFIPEGEIKIIGKVIGTVSSKDLPDKDELGILEEICHDKIMEFREKNRI